VNEALATIRAQSLRVRSAVKPMAAWPSPSLPTLVVAALLILPWSAWTLIANPGPVTGRAFVDTPQYLFTVAGLAILGAWVLTRDRWLGVASLYVTAMAIIHPSDLGLATAHWVALGAGGIVLLGAIKPSARDWIVLGLVVSGLLQVAYTAIQHWKIDLLFFGFRPLSIIVPVGSVGNPKYLGAMLAMIAALGPPRLLPLFVLGLVMSQSVLACVALMIGLMVRYGRLRWWVWPGVTALLALAIWSSRSIHWFHGPSLDSLVSRLAIWQITLQAWLWRGPLTWLFGAGFGTWYVDSPKIQLAAGMNPAEVFFQGHNEGVQLLYEGGIIACAIVAGWVFEHFQDWRESDAFPALVTLAVLCAGLHVLHVPTVIPTGLLVIGLCGISSGGRRS
jgi:hypothetical protein